MSNDDLLLIIWGGSGIMVLTGIFEGEHTLKGKKFPRVGFPARRDKVLTREQTGKFNW